MKVQVVICEKRPLADPEMGEPTVIYHSSDVIEVGTEEAVQFDVMLRAVWPERANAALQSTITVALLQVEEDSE